MNLKKIKIKPGVNLNICQTEQFKTVTLFFAFKDKVDPSEISTYALLAELTKRGTKDYPTSASLANQKEKLYSASMSSLNTIMGEQHIFIMTFSFVDSRFLDEKKPFNEEKKFMESFIFNPLVVKGEFKEDYFKKWQMMYYQNLLNRENTKEAYASRRFVELMNQTHPLSYLASGKAEEVIKLTSKDVYQAYLNLFKRELDIYVIGNVEEEIFVQWCTKNFKEQQEIKALLIVPYKSEKSIEKIEEKRNFNQSFLSLLYTLPIYFNDNRSSAVLFNLIFGGGASSKLFKVVREKHGLCYYIGSNYMSNYGVVTVKCGIDFKNYDKTMTLINQQIEEIKNGNISEEEFNIAKSVALSSIAQSYDSPIRIFSILNTYGSQGIDFDKNERERAIKSVTIEDVIKAAHQLKLSITYLVKQGGSK